MIIRPYTSYKPALYVLMPHSTHRAKKNADFCNTARLVASFKRREAIGRSWPLSCRRPTTDNRSLAAEKLRRCKAKSHLSILRACSVKRFDPFMDGLGKSEC